MRFGYFLKSKWYNSCKYANKSETMKYFENLRPETPQRHGLVSCDLRFYSLGSAASAFTIRAARSMDPLRMTHRPVRHRGFSDPRLWLLWTHQLLKERDFQSANEVFLWLRETSKSRRLVFRLLCDAQAFFPLFFVLFKRDYYLLHFPFGCILYVDTYCGPWETPCSLTGKIPIS